MKLNFKQLMFQVTRRCNLSCDHCAKGEPQNIDLKFSHIDKTIQQVRRVENITITGGEPFLVPDTIRHILDQLQKNRVECYTFSIVTNGTILNEDIASLFSEIATYCKMSQLKRKRQYAANAIIEISNTPYHDNNPEDALEFYKQHCSESVTVFMQDWTKYGTDESNKYEMEYSGRGKGLINSFGSTSLCYHADIKGDNVLCRIQLNADGNVAISELVEYAVEDRFNMGSIDDDCIADKIICWNKIYHLDCKSATKRETAVQALASGRLNEAHTIEAEQIIADINSLF